MNIDDYNEEDKILGIDKITDISPYQKAMIKEEARRKFQMMQNKVYENTIINSHQENYKEVLPGTWMEDEKYRDSQRIFLSIKGERKFIETDSTLMNSKKHYLEKQEYNVLKSKNKRNAISIPLENLNSKNTGSK